MAAAIIKYNNLYLCAQRKISSYSYLSEKYEFPGGKLEDNESLEDALHREIQEELDIEIIIQKELKTIKHIYPDFAVQITFFNCSLKNDVEPKRLDHKNLLWLEKNQLMNVDWAAADLPIVDIIMNQI